VDLFTILFVTAVVLGVLLLVLAVIAVVVLLPPVRRAMRERAHSSEAQSQAPETNGDVEGLDLSDVGE
jgi:uncharacterized protein YhdP